jgi:hypothetical protein
MAPYREEQIRKTADAPTIKAIDMWRLLSTQVLGKPLEVIVDNRRNMPLAEYNAPIDGELSFAATLGYKGQVVLSVWLEPFPKYNPITLTHEIAHWILHLQGYHGLIRAPRYGLLEGEINDLASHKLVHALQRSIGHEPQVEIDSRGNHNIRLSSQSKKADPIIFGLMLADDWLNCSYKIRQKLKWTLQKYQPQTWAVVESILKTASQYVLSQPDANLAFRKEVLKNLKITGNWTEKDEIERTKKLILEVEAKASAKDLGQPNDISKGNNTCNM